MHRKFSVGSCSPVVWDNPGTSDDDGGHGWLPGWYPGAVDVASPADGGELPGDTCSNTGSYYTGNPGSSVPYDFGYTGASDVDSWAPRVAGLHFEPLLLRRLLLLQGLRQELVFGPDLGSNWAPTGHYLVGSAWPLGCFQDH
jgi:hypothetical protein